MWREDHGCGDFDDCIVIAWRCGPFPKGRNAAWHDFRTHMVRLRDGNCCDLRGSFMYGIKISRAQVVYAFIISRALAFVLRQALRLYPPVNKLKMTNKSRCTLHRSIGNMLL